MTQVKQPVGTPKPKAAANQKLYDCKWSKCRKDHPVKLKYPEGGVVTRGAGFRGTLIGKSLQPWDSGSYGVATKPIILASGKIKRAADGSNFEAYETQAHHLIPVDTIKNTTTLKANAILAAWDINAEVNGMLLPKHPIDMAIHELQKHHGSHGGPYNSPISKELREIEKDFENMCHGKSDTAMQEMITIELDALSRRAVNMILNIRAKGAAKFWSLHAGNLGAFNAALLEYARRKILNAKLPP